MSSLSAQIEELTKRKAEAKTGVIALASFLRDHGVSDQLALESEIGELEVQLRRATAALSIIDERVRASTGFASELRQQYEGSASRARSVSGELRERETLLSRLSPLRSQYADDVRKITMLIEARRLFDPLSVVVCPACQTELTEAPAIVDETCTLCRSTVPHLVHEALTNPNGSATNGADGTVDVIQPRDLEAERRSVSSRLTELADFMKQLEEEAAALRSEVRRRNTERSELQLELDAVTRDPITPYLTERDLRSRDVARLRGALNEVRQRQQLLIGLEQRQSEEERLAGALLVEGLRGRLRELNEGNATRESVISMISGRFSSILSDFGFPKLNNAFIDSRLIPYARMVRYDQIGSSGAMTLLSMAWQLAIFELSVETGAGHPGFLLIDSPQKNSKTGDRAEWDEQTVVSIVDRVYRHIIGWVNVHRESAQIIVVDNAPPPWVDAHVVVRYSGNVDEPPYGLIDDATS